MKCSIRFKVLVQVALLVGLTITLLVLEDKCETYDPVGFIQASMPWWQHDEYDQPLPLGGRTRDKIIVVPTMEGADVSWVMDELPE